jgi:hypothetical protein
LTRKQTGIKNTLAVAKKKKIDGTLLRNTNNFLALQKSEETLLDKTKKKLKAWLSMKSLNDTNIKKVLSIFYKNSEIKKICQYFKR